MTRSGRPCKAAQLSESLHKQLNGYALAATAAGVSLLALADPVQGKIVYTPAHERIEAHQMLLLDLNHDGKFDFRLSNRISCSTDVCFTWLAATQLAAENGALGFTAGNGVQWASALKKSMSVGPGGHFYSTRRHYLVFMDYGSLWRTSPWANVKSRYLGLKFQIHGQTHYAWARLGVKVTHRGTFGHITGTLTGYAYETIPNKPIIAGKTKGPGVITVQPGSLGHLAAGAAVR